MEFSGDVEASQATRSEGEELVTSRRRLVAVRRVSGGWNGSSSSNTHRQLQFARKRPDEERREEGEGKEKGREEKRKEEGA